MGTTADKLKLVLTSKNDIKSALTELDETPGDMLSTYADNIRTFCSDVETIITEQDEKIAELANVLTAKAGAGIYVSFKNYSVTDDGNGNITIINEGA